MFNLFNCSAFETSTSVQAINDVLFPVVLFVVIFWLMCEIFLIDVAVEGNLPVDEEFTNGIVQTQIDKDNSSQKAEDDRIGSDVDTGHQNLKALGTRKLRDFCRNSKIKGYASAYNRRGLDGLVEFLLTKQIYAHQIEQ
ncbi:hypothetical protein RIVM261_048940 [Rivularia sp. IAM M-261]|nr:hypothetical protein RIVM261_048940 [Rivularia sp. IAM M-261]